MDDKELLEEISYERNHADSTKILYQKIMQTYTKFHNMSMVELLDEADDEEEQGIRWKKRKLKKRLIQYRKWLLDNYKVSSANQYLVTIKSIYKHYDIEIHKLPTVSDKNINKSKNIVYEDLPTKEDIRLAISLANPLMKAIILFIINSGTSRSDVLNLRIVDYINCTHEFHNSNTDDVYEVIDILNNLLDAGITVTPRLELKRQKTGVEYYTFFSVEAVRAINDYLLTRKDLKSDDKLFKIEKSYLNQKFRDLNKKIGLGTVNGYANLRPHMLRKFHASNLVLGDNGLSFDVLDALQGRGKSKTRSSYFFEDYNQLRKDYLKALPNILVEYESNIINVESDEFLQLKHDKEQLELEHNRIKESISDEVHKQIRELMKKSWEETQQKLKE